jgi:hypothetical protein
MITDTLKLVHHTGEMLELSLIPVMEGGIQAVWNTLRD